jgi:hypothetical protein
MAALTMLQARAAVPQFNAGDATAIFSGAMNAINSVLGPAIHLAAFVAVVWMLWEFFKGIRKSGPTFTRLEIIGFALVLVLMKA